MTTASTLLQVLALSALFAIHVATPDEEQMSGMRRAVETISVAGKQMSTPTEVPAAAGPAA